MVEISNEVTSNNNNNISNNSNIKENQLLDVVFKDCKMNESEKEEKKKQEEKISKALIDAAMK